MTRFVPHARAIPSLLLALCGACVALSGCADMFVRDYQDMQATLAALPPQCTLGNATDAAGAWVAAPQTGRVPGSASSWLFTFNEPVRTDAFRVALNPLALHNLEKVETQDAQGNWSTAWTGGQVATPAGCNAVKMAQAFASGGHEITALRIIFHPVFGETAFANVGVRKAG